MARIILFLLVLLFCPPCTQALAAKPLNSPEYKALVFKGEVLSREIARTTGIALNPILCMSALGAYRYFSTDAASRATLPWHAQPLFWGSLSFVLFLLFLKDSGKLALPKVLMVPLDAAETLIEKKSTALLALPLLFSLVYNGEYEQLRQVSLRLIDGLAPVSTALAAAGPDTAGSAGFLLTLAVVYILFVLVWVVSHAINILILLSPFSWLDLFLATIRNLLAGTVLALGNTIYGTVLALVTIAVSVWLFPRALRLVVLGTVVAFDLVVYRMFGRKLGPLSPDRGIGAFTSCSMDRLRPNTHVLIRERHGRLVLTARPAIVGPGREMATMILARDCTLKPGLLSPTIAWNDPAGQTGPEIQIFRLRPRYSLAPEQAAAALAMPLARDESLADQLKGWFSWLASLLRAPVRLEALNNRG